MLKPSDLVSMTGPNLLEHVEDLERRCRQLAQGWRVPTAGICMPDEELSKRMSTQWDALAAVLGEAREKVLELVRHEIHDESCGA
jgi:hypothetical protein